MRSYHPFPCPVKKLSAITAICLAIPAILSAQTSEIVIDDFEEGIHAWKSQASAMVEESGEVHGGMLAGRLMLNEGAGSYRALEITDWSEYEGFSFWAYSPLPNSAVVALVVRAGPTEGQQWSYFFRKIEVNWSGWKEFVIPKNSMKAVRSAEWTQVSSIHFTVSGWPWAVPSPGDYIILDDLHLLTREQMER